MRPLHPVHGHGHVRQGLAQAIAAGRLPQVLLLEGPYGVGKQRLALWLAQRLVCEAPLPSGEPCGSCRPCYLAVRLGHPDIHWFIPLELAKKSSDPDKQVELAEEALGEVLAARREDPLYGPPGGMAAHGMASARLLLRRMALTPVLGGPRVFIVGNAERLLPQAGLADAANAVLKALEEPPSRTWFVLTAADPGQLLPTLLSRTVRVRVPRLADSDVTAFVQSVMSDARPGLNAADLAAMAQGCIGQILATESAGGSHSAAVQFLDATRGGSIERYARVLAQPPFEARGAFTELLDGLLERLRTEATRAEDTTVLVEAIARVLHARAAAQGNLNPQLLAAVLASDLALEGAGA